MAMNSWCTHQKWRLFHSYVNVKVYQRVSPLSCWLSHRVCVFHPGSTQSAFQPSTFEGTGAALPSGVAKPGKSTKSQGEDPGKPQGKPGNSSHVRWKSRLAQSQSTISKATLAKCSTQHSGSFCNTKCPGCDCCNYTDFRNSSHFQWEILRI